MHYFSLFGVDNSVEKSFFNHKNYADRMYQTDKFLTEMAISAGIVPGLPCYHWGLNSYFSALRSVPDLTRLPNKWLTLDYKCFLLAEHWRQEGQFYVFIKTLITHPDYRRQGYAKQILNLIKEVAIKTDFKNEIILVPAACDWVTSPEEIDWRKQISSAQIHEGTSPCPSAPLNDKQLEDFYLSAGWRPNVVTELYAIDNSAFGYHRVEECSVSNYGRTQNRQILAWRKDFEKE